MKHDPSRLELSPDEMRAFGYAVVDLLTERFSNMSADSVGAKLDREALHEMLAGFPAKVRPIRSNSWPD